MRKVRPPFIVIFTVFKHLHISCALVSVAGFALRGFWMYRGSPLLQHRLTKVLPHIIDTMLLVSAVVMLYLWGQWPWQHSWLMAKLVALLLYITLGMVALRYGRNRTVRTSAWLAALVVAGYLVSVALSHNACGFLC